MDAALFYTAGDLLSGPELCAARLDGHLMEVGMAYMPADTVEGSWARAAGIRSLVVDGTAASGPTAAWIHGAGDAAPTRHHLHRSSATRIRLAMEPFFIFHDAAIAPEDLIWAAELAVTTPERTLFDLALGLQRYPEHQYWARALHDVCPQAHRAAEQRLLSHPRIPGAKKALRFVRELDQEEVTR